MSVARESSVALIQQRLECPVCLDRFKKPKLLPCQHTFCLTPCLNNLIDRSNRRIKCPECRAVHIVPVQGVEAYPNNITILKFLDLDFSRSLTNNFLDKCYQCNKRIENLVKCLDCEKFFCDQCRPTHLGQLKNETKQNVLNLRRTLPKLSQKVGNYEQKNTIIIQNMDTVKREISSVIQRLIDDLKNRERSLHAEAEVLMEAQIRTNGIEKENAEIELSSVSSFCDSTEPALNRDDQNHHNEVALINKQCKNFSEQLKNMDGQTNELKKLVLTVADLRDFSTYIKKFGYLSETNSRLESASNNQFPIENGHHQSLTSLSRDQLQNLTQSSTNFNSDSMNQRRTWDRNQIITNIPSFNYDTNFHTPRTSNTVSNPNTERTDRNVVPPPRFQAPPPVTFNIGIETSTRNINNNINTNRRSDPTPNIQSPVRPLVRSNTFTIEENNESENSSNIRAVDVTDLYSVRRGPRAKTPMTFNIMLDDTENNGLEGLIPRMDSSRQNSYIQFETPAMPSVDYASKSKAKTIIGKQGRENGEFVWPVDVSINHFNDQILIADSGNHRVQIFESTGKYVKCFGKMGNREGQLNTVSGLFIDSMSNIFVVDRLNHRLQIFDRYCRYLRSIGLGEGKSAGQLNHPFSCFVNKISEIFVCDKENDRISVFHSSGKYLRSFGKLGSNRGQFDKPYYVHVDRANHVLVSDCSNHRIQVFDSKGVFLNTFGTEGSNLGQLKHPRGITTDKEGFILVADSGNSRIQVFHPGDYSYVTHFGSSGTESGKFRGLEGIAINPKNGDVIICDKENHRVQIL